MRRKFFVVPVIAVLVTLVALYLHAGPFVKGYYDAIPHTDGKPDTGKLAQMLSESNANTYNFLVQSPERDIPVLEEFLPEAERIGVDVWVTILPPSELSDANRNNKSFTDYIGIARRLSLLSEEYPALKAWSLDNVLLDYRYFTPAYLKSITDAGKEHSELQFIPVVYYNNVMSPEFADRKQYFDGIQLYYTHFPEAGSGEAELFIMMVDDVRKKYKGTIVTGIYATPASSQFPTTPEYIGELLNLAKQHTDGVMIYTFDQSGDKLSVIEEAFA